MEVESQNVEPNNEEIFDKVKSEEKIDAASITSSANETLSKRQLKRLRRRQERHVKWIEGKIERRKKEKEKRKIKKQKEQLVLDTNPCKQPSKKIRKEMRKSKCKVSVVIDCDYDQYMNEQEIQKLVKQINRCYSINRNSPQPVQFYVTSVTGRIKEFLNKNQSGYVHWDAHVSEKHWLDVFKEEVELEKSRGEVGRPKNLENSIIYLTADSPKFVPNCEEIRQENNNIFIIGGLIDHNRHKGLALEKAQNLKVDHAQLPIDEHIKMAQRKVLSIPHVFEIMALASSGEFGHLGKSWKEIFEKVIPARKIAK